MARTSLQSTLGIIQIVEVPPLLTSGKRGELELMTKTNLPVLVLGDTSLPSAENLSSANEIKST
jgi:hypothetical protein